jgi:hypothetical protein
MTETLLLLRKFLGRWINLYAREIAELQYTSARTVVFFPSRLGFRFFFFVSFLSFLFFLFFPSFFFSSFLFDLTKPLSHPRTHSPIRSGYRAGLADLLSGPPIPIPIPHPPSPISIFTSDNLSLLPGPRILKCPWGPCTPGTLLLVLLGSWVLSQIPKQQQQQQQQTTSSCWFFPVFFFFPRANDVITVWGTLPTTVTHTTTLSHVSYLTQTNPLNYLILSDPSVRPSVRPSVLFLRVIHGPGIGS